MGDREGMMAKMKSSIEVLEGKVRYISQRVNKKDKYETQKKRSGKLEGKKGISNIYCIVIWNTRKIIYMLESYMAELQIPNI